MSTKDLLLAIDNGTQSLKALVFDLEGQLLAKEQVKFTPYFSKQPAWAEQDPDVFWQLQTAGLGGTRS
jgi:sugar (pentulose or hexulose) kinase